MSEIKYYDGGVGMPDAAFYDGFNGAFAYGGADRSHEGDADILTGVSVTTGYGTITATATEGTAQTLGTGTLAASTEKHVHVAIPSGADSETLQRTLEAAGKVLGQAASAAVTAVAEADAGIELTLNLSRSTVYNALVDVKTVMDERGCPADGRVAVMPPTIFGELLKDPDVKAETDIEVTGSMKTVAGFKVAVDDGLDGEIICYQHDALAAAAIVSGYERTAAAVKAQLNVGALVVNEDGVALVTVS